MVEGYGRSTAQIATLLAIKPILKNSNLVNFKFLKKWQIALNFIKETEYYNEIWFHAL